MTIRIPGRFAVGLGALAVFLAVSFLMAEWRARANSDDPQKYVECVRLANEREAKARVELQKNAPQPPTSPGSGTTTEQRAAYDLAFRQYQRETDADRARWSELSATYDSEIRECGKILD